MKPMYYVKQMKNGQWRVYREVQQAITAWLGTNDKRTVLREERIDASNYGVILQFPTRDAAAAFVKAQHEANVYDDS